MKDLNGLSEKIDKIIESGSKNRNSILDDIVSGDEELIRVLKQYKKGKSESEIMIELKKPIDEIRNDIKLIDDINRLIDSRVSVLSARKTYTNIVMRDNMPHSTDEELNASITKARRDLINKKHNARVYLSKYFYEYQQDKKYGTINKEKLLKDLKEIVKNIEITGNRSTDVMFLVSIYNDVGNYKKADEILQLYDPKDLPELERRNYHMLKDRNKKLRNKQVVENLYKMGYSPEQILNFCEKEVSEYRAPYLDLKFIARVLEAYFGYNRAYEKNIKNQNKENEKDELEL